MPREVGEVVGSLLVGGRWIWPSVNSTEYFAIRINIEETMVEKRENFTKRKLMLPQAEEPTKFGEEPPKHCLVFKTVNCCFAKTYFKNWSYV